MGALYGTPDRRPRVPSAARGRRSSATPSLCRCSRQFKWGVACQAEESLVRRRADEHLARDWWPLGATSRPALSGCGESPGSGDDLSPGWRRTWAHRESSHGRQGRAPRPQGDTVTSTSPVTGADSAPDPPGYAPITQSAPGPQSVTGRAGSPGATARGGNRRLGLPLLVTATAQLTVVLDSTIVNVALPPWSLVSRPSPRDHGHLT